MKKTSIIIILLCCIIGCKKKTNSQIETICDGNTKINFKSILKNPIGKFLDTLKDIDGNFYKTVKINNQIWMAENLKVTRYNDGTLIPNITDREKWLSLNVGSWCYYNNDKCYNDRYGKLYNWYTTNNKVNNNKNICPQDWHVPKHEDWKKLKDFLYKEYGWVEGNSLKEVDTTINWGIYATNASLFTALPAGARYYGGGFVNFNAIGFYWTSTEYYDSTEAYSVDIVDPAFSSLYTSSAVYNMTSKNNGYSIRCVKD